MMHFEIMDTVGTLCDISYVYIEGFERPLQPVWAILAVIYLIFCAEMVTKTRIWLATKWVSFWYDSHVMRPRGAIDTLGLLTSGNGLFSLWNFKHL